MEKNLTKLKNFYYCKDSVVFILYLTELLFFSNNSGIFYRNLNNNFYYEIKKEIFLKTFLMFGSCLYLYKKDPNNYFICTINIFWSF